MPASPNEFQTCADNSTASRCLQILPLWRVHVSLAANFTFDCAAAHPFGFAQGAA
jgi:hypothetical protein